jgi:hypothetical protein
MKWFHIVEPERAIVDHAIDAMSSFQRNQRDGEGDIDDENQ